MGLFSKSKSKFSSDGGVIGIPFGYLPLRNPLVSPVETIDLMPGLESEVSASDEFYGKFLSLIMNKRIDVSVYNSWMNIEETEFSEYKGVNLGKLEYAKFSRAAMTGYLMAVCEVDVFKTFRKNEMATYIIGAMQIYIRDVERAVSMEAQKVLLTGLLSGYHKAHSLYREAEPTY